jgi:hypothetical protein
MAILVTHKFQSAKTDGVDTTVVRPSNWNDTHNITCAGGVILGREVGSAGDVQELPLSFSGGNVGINTTSPQARLDVNGTIRSNGNFTLAGATGFQIYPYYISASNHNSILAGGDGSLVFSTGTAGVSARLTLGLSAAFTVPVVSSSSGSAGVAGSFQCNNSGHSGLVGLSQDGGAYAYLGYQNANGVYASANSTRTAIRSVASSGLSVHATSSGNIAVYAVTTANAAAVYGESSQNYGVDGRTTNASAGGVIGFAANTAIYGICGYANTYSFYGSTTAFLASGSWATSDERFKDVQEHSPFTKPALDIVRALPVLAFRIKGPWAATSVNGVDQFGWIAQQVEKEIPIAVSDLPVPPNDLAQRAFLKGVSVPEAGTAEADALAAEQMTFKGLNEKYLVATLWAAVQELSAKVEQLESRNVQG